MLKIFSYLLLMLFLTSCASFAGGLMAGSLSKGKTGPGAKFYKYKCEKVDQCCEVGKNCEEDIKNKKAKE